AVEHQAAPKAFHDLTADRQTKSGPRALRIGTTLELPEDALTILCRDAGAIVGDPRLVSPFVADAGDGYQRLRIVVVLDGIGNEVDEDLRQLVGIAENEHRLGLLHPSQHHPR